MKSYLLIGGAVAAFSLLGVTHWHAYRTGRSVEQASFIKRINQENSNAGRTAEKWRADLLRCNDVGGVYDFATGACDH